MPQNFLSTLVTFHSVKRLLIVEGMRSGHVFDNAAYGYPFCIFTSQCANKLRVQPLIQFQQTRKYETSDLQLLVAEYELGEEVKGVCGARRANQQCVLQ